MTAELECPNCRTSLAHAPLHAIARNVESRQRSLRRGRSGWLSKPFSDMRTLELLLLRPGRLSREHLEGRRQRYVPPLRLYLAASFVFFLVVKVLGISSHTHIVVAPAIDARGNAVTR